MKTAKQKMEGWFVITGFFNEEKRVSSTVAELLSIGVPRDLIEVVVAKKDVSRFFKEGRVRKLNLTTALAAKGALIGLIVFSGMSAALIVTSGAQEDQRLTWIMLLGPNMGVLLGGMIGMIWGSLRKASLPERYSRLREGKGILLVTRTRFEKEAAQIEDKIKQHGAEGVEVH